MLVVLFQVGQARYALPSRDVIEVVPRLELRTLASAPAWLAGLAHVRGEIVPVIDLVARLEQRPASPVLSSRIALVRVATRRGPSVLGVLAERMTGTARLGAAGTYRSIALPDAPFLGEVRLDGGQLVQLLRPELLCTEDVEQILFAEAPS